MIRLSLCMIVKNEAKYLARCLESVRGIVDEMIIVDTGSTDTTVEIAQSFGARVFRQQWQDDFSKARNFALQQATGDWVLQLDADEYVDSESRDEVRQRIAVDGIIGYSVIVDNLLGDEARPGHRHESIFRLFRRHPGMTYEGRIHEQVTLSAARTGVPGAESRIRVVHSGYLDHCLKDKARRNLRLLLSHLDVQPNDPYLHYQTGQTYNVLGELELAHEHLSRARVTLGANATTAQFPYLDMLFLSDIFASQNAGKIEQALALCEQGMRQCPRFLDIVYAKATLLLNNGRYEEARQAFARCLQDGDAGDPGIKTYKSEYGVARSALELSDLASAKIHAERALASWPQPVAPVARLLVGEVALRQNDVQSALVQLRAVVREEPSHVAAWLHLAKLCMGLGRHAEVLDIGNTLARLDVAASRTVANLLFQYCSGKNQANDRL